MTAIKRQIRSVIDPAFKWFFHKKAAKKKIKAADDISPTFCVLPWIHLSTRPNGHMRLCCTSNASSAGASNDKKWGGEVGILKKKGGLPANFNHTDIKTAWNSDYMKEIRKNMLEGKIAPSCTKCFKEEKQGYQSKRNWENRHWFGELPMQNIVEQTEPDGQIPDKIYYIDLRLGTKCNLKCVMCSPHDSSLWVSDWNQLYPQIKNPSLKEIMTWPNKGRVDGASYNWYRDNPGFWNQLLDQIPNMKQLYFAGGESTIIPEHYELLEICVKKGYAKQIYLRYNSNGVEIPDRLLELWKEFRSVMFHFSLDSIHEQNDYIRFPSDFSILEKHLRRLDETPANISITIACAVQVLNIYYIPDFIKWKLSCGFKKINAYPKSAGLIDTHFVYHPAHLNVKILPLWFKKEVVKKFKDFYPWLEKKQEHYKDFRSNPYGIKRLKGMCQFMLSEDWSNRLPEFQEYILRMDRIRGTDFKKTFPEMASLLNGQYDQFVNGKPHKPMSNEFVSDSPHEDKFASSRLLNNKASSHTIKTDKSASDSSVSDINNNFKSMNNKLKNQSLNNKLNAHQSDKALSPNFASDQPLDNKSYLNQALSHKNNKLVK